MWLNWPVNDYKDARLMLGKAEILTPGTHNIAGVVSNPMGHAELSKIALFAVADFTWNSDDFNDDESWLNSFKYVAPEAAEELHIIASHLSDPSPSGHGLVVGESEEMKPALESFLSKFSNGKSIQEIGNQLLDKFDTVLLAIKNFKEKSQNSNMEEEIDPWLTVLKNVVEADKSAVKSAISLQNDELDPAWEGLAKAAASLSESKTIKIKKLNYPDVTVEAGAKRLAPFANDLIKMLDAKISLSLNPEYTQTITKSSYDSQTLDQMIDGDLNTFSYIQTIQKNGDWYGVDFGKTIMVNDIEIIQGRNDSDHDIFQRGILEVSIDGLNWTPVGSERSGFRISEKGLDIEARYVRYKLTHAGIPGGKPDLWTAIREFTVNGGSENASIYTNVSELMETPLSITEETVELANVENITLKPSEYLGVQLPTIEEVSQVTLESSDVNLVLESSENGVEWTPVTNDGPYVKAAYVRLINNGEKEISFDLRKLFIKIQKFTEPNITHNYEGVYSGTLDTLFNGKLEEKTWFRGLQNSGNYVQLDLGGIIEVENVAVVINDGEGDYFREGDLEISIDGTTWETIHTFNNPNDRSLNFPEHEVPYRYNRVQVDGKSARYVRLISTKNHPYWLALNEIIVNEGLERPSTQNHTIKAVPQGDTGIEVINVIDQRLSTFYKPKGDLQAGSLNYKISKNNQLNQIIILQDPSAISNAEVSVRDVNGWHKIGELSQSFNSLSTSRYNHVLEVMIQWTGDVSPIINEIITVKRDGNLPRIQVGLLDEELQLAFAQGLITHKGILNSLLAKTDAIQKHQGNKEQSLKVLNAFENEVKAQSDKKVNKDYSRLLLEITDEIRMYFTSKE